MTPIDIAISGEPRPKGSMRGFAMRSKSGKYTARLTHDNAKTKPWQKQVEAGIRAAMEALDIDQPIDEPVSVSAMFFMTKPKSVRRSFPSTKPDLDKLQRVIGDALEGTLLTNDSRIIVWRVGKLYGDEPGVHITVEGIDDE